MNGPMTGAANSRSWAVVPVVLSEPISGAVFGRPDGADPQGWSWLVIRAWLDAHQWVVPVAFGLIALAVVAGALGRDRLLTWRQKRWSDGARWVTIAPPPEVTAEAAPALWVTLAGVLTPARWQRLVYGSAHVAWEYIWAGRVLTIRIWTPATIPPGSVEAAVQAAWPGATLTTEPAGDPIPAQVAEEAGGALWPAEADVLPLRTDHDVDPLRALLAAGAAVGHREHACLQILARPANPRRIRDSRRTARTMINASAPARPIGVGLRAGTDPAGRALSGATQLVAKLATEPVTWLGEVFLPGSGHRRSGGAQAGRTLTPMQRDPVADAQHRAVGEKAAAVPHFEVTLRYAVASAVTGPLSRDRARQLRERHRGLAHTLASSAATYTRPGRLRRMRMSHPVTVLAQRRLRRGFLATTEELGVLAALPRDLAVPGLDRARAKAVPAPAAVPSGGRGVKVLGRAQVGARAVALNTVDARQHVHLIGKTGVGKSTLLLNMIMSDVNAGRGVVVIDPRGDLITDILDRLPADYAQRRGRRLAIIDPDQPNPACFNPLDVTSHRAADGGGDVHLAVDNLVSVFSKIFARAWGPRMDDTLRVACLTLMRQPRPTLALVPPLLNDRRFRAPFTAELSDPEGLGGFWEWYDSMNDGLRATVIGPVLARLRQFLLRDFVRDVIGHVSSSFSMSEILDGGLLLCRLPKGVLGEDTVKILGSLIVARTWQAAIARATIPEADRRDASLYVDEAHNFLNLPGSVDDMLAEARGFHLGLVLAHQNLAQLPAETQAALSANARTKLIFNIDPNDAKELSKHTLPEIDEHDLAHLDVHTAAARLLVTNRELPAFTFVTNPPSDPLKHTAAIRAAAAAAHVRTSDEPDTETPTEPGTESGGDSGAADRSRAGTRRPGTRQHRARSSREPPAHGDRPMRA